MNFSVYTIIFNECLTPEQKRIIESSIESMQQKMVIKAEEKIDNITKIKKGWRGEMIKRIPGGMAGLEAIETGRALIRANATKYIYFEWPDASTMKLFYCSERLKGLPVVDEGKIIKGFRKFIFPDMGLSADPLVKKEIVDVEL